MKKLCVFVIAIFLPVSFIFAQDGSSIPATDPSVSPATSSPATSSVKDPRDVVPTPPTGGSVIPRDSLQETTPILTEPAENETIIDPVLEENEDPKGITPSTVVFILGTIAAIYGGYMLRKNTKGKENKKEDKSRCFDIKSLMDKKLEELTDIRGQIEGKIKDKTKEQIQEMAKDTAFSSVLASIEKTEKEYSRLKQLYS